MNALALRRGRAYLRDCLTYLGIAAAMLPLGLLAHRQGWGASRTFVLLTSAVPPVAATVLAAVRESGPRQASPGKAGQRLVVTTLDGSTPGRTRATVRNVLKIAVPWQLGHTVAVGATFGGFEDRDPLTLGATAITYPLLGVMLLGLLRGQGRTLHDRLAGTRVVPASGQVVPPGEPGSASAG